MFVHVDTDNRMRKAAAVPSRPNRLTLEPGDLCHLWREGNGWSPGMSTVVLQVGQGHCYVDDGGLIFQHAAEELSNVAE